MQVSSTESKVNQLWFFKRKKKKAKGPSRSIYRRVKILPECHEENTDTFIHGVGLTDTIVASSYAQIVMITRETSPSNLKRQNDVGSNKRNKKRRSCLCKGLKYALLSCYKSGMKCSMKSVSEPDDDDECYLPVSSEKKILPECNTHERFSKGKGLVAVNDKANYREVEDIPSLHVWMRVSSHTSGINPTVPSWSESNSLGTDAAGQPWIPNILGVESRQSDWISPTSRAQEPIICRELAAGSEGLGLTFRDKKRSVMFPNEKGAVPYPSIPERDMPTPQIVLMARGGDYEDEEEDEEEESGENDEEESGESDEEGSGEEDEYDDEDDEEESGENDEEGSGEEDEFDDEDDEEESGEEDESGDDDEGDEDEEDDEEVGEEDDEDDDEIDYRNAGEYPDDDEFDGNDYGGAPNVYGGAPNVYGGAPNAYGDNDPRAPGEYHNDGAPGNPSSNKPMATQQDNSKEKKGCDSCQVLEALEIISKLFTTPSCPNNPSCPGFPGHQYGPYGAQLPPYYAPQYTAGYSGSMGGMGGMGMMGNEGYAPPPGKTIILPIG